MSHFGFALGILIYDIQSDIWGFSGLCSLCRSLIFRNQKFIIFCILSLLFSHIPSAHISFFFNCQIMHVLSVFLFEFIFWFLVLFHPSFIEHRTISFEFLPSLLETSDESHFFFKTWVYLLIDHFFNTLIIQFILNNWLTLHLMEHTKDSLLMFSQLSDWKSFELLINKMFWIEWFLDKFLDLNIFIPGQ